MAISYQHPKVKVHVGDGFKFLDDYKNEFDVIITDSSDPEGPAESLFQKPYFELLFGALKDGGVITTQGCTFSFVCGAKWFFYFRIYFCFIQFFWDLEFILFCQVFPIFLVFQVFARSSLHSFPLSLRIHPVVLFSNLI